MLFIISPAKTLNFKSMIRRGASTPVFLERADKLAQKLKKKSPGNLEKLFHVSEELAVLNYERYQNWDASRTKEFGKKAMHAFNGHVYQKIDVDTLGAEEIQYANDHLRILSGMYGLLKPSDLILPHRLEMGTKWPVSKRNLYGYWSRYVTKELNITLEHMGADTIVNLASTEYLKVIDKSMLNGRIIDIVFRERRAKGKYEVISIFAKQARGLMCRFAFQHKIQALEELTGFDSEGYMFNYDMSEENKFVFTRG